MKERKAVANRLASSLAEAVAGVAYVQTVLTGMNALRIGEAPTCQRTARRHHPSLECGSASYRRWLEFQGGSFAAALHDALNNFTVSERPSADRQDRLC